MNEKMQARLSTALFLLLIGALAIVALLTPDEEYSLSERRKLAQFPTISWESIGDGEAMSGFSSYMADQFPLREELRAVKEKLVFGLYQQKDNNGIYQAQGHISELDEKLDRTSVENFLQRILRVREMYLQDNDVWFALVPDKNYFLAEQSGYPALDYAAMQQMLASGLAGKMETIDLFETLSLEDYYTTDPHWRAECLKETADALAEAMGAKNRLSDTAEILTMPQPFYGVYASRTALPLAADTIRYPMNDAIAAAQVTDLDRNASGGVYWGEGDERDRYTFFLNGSSSLLTIENPQAKEKKELVLFRDSFGSALAPWLVEAYSKITVVDIRYIAPEMLERFVEFEDADVLFLYSSSVVNNSVTLK
ncbi:MAG: hypothetical protein E7457_02960 [Ruminococcaceae bacterium]|nr:hypothetical protein [Oscillospiraceae bacterium]